MRAGARIGIVLRQRDIDREAEIDRETEVEKERC